MLNKPKDLPNVDGYKFKGVLSDRREFECKVVRDKKTGCHYVEPLNYCDLIGWYKL